MSALVRPIEILLVEDNPGDVRLMKEMLADARVANHLAVVGTGSDALEYLGRQGRHARAPGPDLILLDLNLPGMSGEQVLTHIKSNPVLRRIPVVILTSSRAEEDVLRSYDLHANAYVVKPLDLPQFVTVVRTIEEFWLAVVKLPNL